MTNAMKFSRYSVMDDPALIGGDAFSLLIPSDWQVEGGLAWRLHPVLPAYLVLRVSSPDRTEAVETFPALMFVWAEGGIPLYPPGSTYLGNEVAEPMEDPVLYVKQVVLPRFRKNVTSPQVMATEELPKVAEVIAQNEQEPGLQKKFRAARVRIEYVENGRGMQEDIYCVLASAYASATHTTVWGTDRNYAFKTEKGKMDLRANVLQTVMSSFRPNLQWFNRYVQLVQLLAQGRIEGLRHPIEFGAYIKQGTTEEINGIRRQLYDLQQSAQERINASFLTYVRRLDEYRNPLDHRRVLLPTSASAWTNRRGDYLLAADASFDPNSGSTNDWLRVEVYR
jgi:hypothetical protein